MWCDQESLLCLATLVQNDVGPEKRTTDAAYAFGNTKHVEKCILDGIGELYMRRRTSRIILLDLAPGYPYDEKEEMDRYSGYNAWRFYLLRYYRIYSSRIEPLMSPSPKSGEDFPLSHTGSEAEEFVRLAKEREWESVYVVSHPIHQLRAFILTVTMAQQIYPDLRIYSWPGRQKKRWVDPAPRGHNVATDGSQFAFLVGELKRLNKRHGNRWNPLPAEDIIQYIKRRDS